MPSKRRYIHLQEEEEEWLFISANWMPTKNWQKTKPVGQDKLLHEEALDTHHFPIFSVRFKQQQLFCMQNWVH